jgi:DNA (cytosine-5)-methyltransferase 1
MLGRQFYFNLNNDLIVDLFAGGGGASTGIELATGRHVDIAVNHDPEAVAMHEMNHPQAKHFCEDIFEVDPVAVTNGRPVALLWASPDCKHFSKAKGGKPVSKKIRSLAWGVVKWARLVRPKIICLENVEEFQTWGPLVNDTPDPAQKGETFRRWIAELRNLGYNVDYKELRACDYGAPTIRKRFFLVARCDGFPIVWPQPTHGKKGLKPYRTAAEIIDWSLPCPSIFGRNKPLSDNTLRRIANGIFKFVINTKKPFIVKDCANILIQMGYGDADGRRVLDLVKPLGTITSGGNKFALVSAFLAKHYSGVVGTRADNPLGTITTVDHHSLVTVGLSETRTNNEEEVRAFLINYYGTGMSADLNEPLNTATGNVHSGLVVARIAGKDYAIADIGLRMLQPHELYAAQGFPKGYIFDRRNNGTPLSKAAQVRMCGNSVCPAVAAAVVKANYRTEEKIKIA